MARSKRSIIKLLFPTGNEMRLIFTIFMVFFILPISAWADKNQEIQLVEDVVEVTWKSGMDVETFWMKYADSKGGLTWGKTATYPEYAKVKEGDTLLIQVKQGLCLMEFFHSRWRTANNVRRWHESINTYGGCPYVFD
ncbi:MAG: hypothetical protein ACI8O8_002240 [Oleiphilaceae bacterium]|jgi:hypothetical protein